MGEETLMKIRIDWQKPIELTRNKRFVVDPDTIAERFEPTPVVYFFSRRFGDSFLPFYIGETLSISERHKTHLSSVKIVDVLRSYPMTEEKIKNGARYFHAGYLRGKFTRENTKKRLGIVQRHIIRQAIANDIPILNNNLTTIKTHELEFTGADAWRAHMEKHYSVEM